MKTMKMLDEWMLNVLISIISPQTT